MSFSAGEPGGGQFRCARLEQVRELEREVFLGLQVAHDGADWLSPSQWMPPPLWRSILSWLLLGGGFPWCSLSREAKCSLFPQARGVSREHPREIVPNVSEVENGGTPPLDAEPLEEPGPSPAEAPGLPRALPKF